MSRPAPSSTDPAQWPLIYSGLALTTLATLLLELALTRIFSVVFYYHFAFLAISIALFGLGAGGIFSYAVARWRGEFFLKLCVKFHAFVFHWERSFLLQLSHALLQMLNPISKAAEIGHILKRLLDG